MRPRRAFKGRPFAKWVKIDDEAGTWYFSVDEKEALTEFVPKVPEHEPEATGGKGGGSVQEAERAGFHLSPMPKLGPLPRSAVNQIHEIEHPSLPLDRQIWNTAPQTRAGLLPIFDRGTRRVVMCDDQRPDEYWS
jgi:hypothetical protein